MAKNNHQYTRIPFAAAIEWFRAKENFDTDSWRDLVGAEHAAAFAVAGAKGAVLQSLRDATDRAIAQGVSLADFRQDFARIVAATGWAFRGQPGWRAETIYRDNIRSAYAAGRRARQQDPEVLETRPALQWRHGGSTEPRPQHLALDGRVFSATDPWWDASYPPCGHGCKCRIYSLSEQDLARKGLAISDPPEAEEFSPDRGWGSGHRDFTPEARRQILDRATARLHPTLAQAINREVDSRG